MGTKAKNSFTEAQENNFKDAVAQLGEAKSDDEREMATKAAYAALGFNRQSAWEFTASHLGLDPVTGKEL